MHRKREIELLEGIRAGVSVGITLLVGFQPWDLSWHSVAVKLAIATAAWALIWKEELKRAWKSSGQGKRAMVIEDEET